MNNDFENLVELSARNFLKLKEQLIELPASSSILNIGILPTGTYHAIVQVKGKKKPTKTRAKINDDITPTESVDSV